MGERGPKPTIVQALEPARRAELDEAIIDGRQTKTDLYEQFGKPAGVSYSRFCAYASQLEARSKHRYVGELLRGVFGNLPDSDIDVRARGIMLAMLDKIAADVLHDGELKPRDLRDVVHSYDMIRRGAIAEAHEKREQMEWEVIRMAGVAEAATWIKRELEAEIATDPELRERLSQVVDRYCAQLTKPTDKTATVSLVKQLSKKFGWTQDVLRMFDQMFGIGVSRAGGDKPRMTEAQFKEEVQSIYGNVDMVSRKPLTASPAAGDVHQAIDDCARGKNDSDGKTVQPGSG